MYFYESNLLTTAEAAEFLRLKKETLQIWRCRDKSPNLPFIKIGKAVRYRLSDLEEFIQNGITSREDR